MPFNLFFSRLKISSYSIFSALKIAALALFFWTCLAAKAFFDFHHAQDDYMLLFKREEAMRNYLNENGLQALQRANKKELIFSEKLSGWLKKHHVILPRERSFMTPRQFQDQLQKDVLDIEEKARGQSVGLPASFFLGLSEYATILPAPEKVPTLSKQEFLLLWIAERLTQYSYLNLTQFSFESQQRKLDLIKAEQLGYLTLAFTIDESSFQKLFNEIENSPYCFLIENLSVENNYKNEPAHLLKNNTPQIKIILGHELLTIFMKIRMLDFYL